jgi:hypothetical protein
MDFYECHSAALKVRNARAKSMANFVDSHIEPPHCHTVTVVSAEFCIASVEEPFLMVT